MDRNRIFKDYLEASRNISEILDPNNPRSNFWVTGLHYLTPTIRGVEVALEDQSGELQYYKGIREALEQALETGKITGGVPNAPAYVSELFER